MKEIIYNIDAVAGRVITLTGLTDTTLTKNNVLGIINKTTGDPLYTPLDWGKLTFAYSNGTMTLTLDNSITALNAGDKLFIKMYTDVDSTSSNIATILSLLQSGDDAPEELPEGVGDRLLLLLQFFGIAGSFEAQAVGEETSENPVIDECKTQFADAFSELLPSGFTMPNSVTIGSTTYVGTVS